MDFASDVPTVESKNGHFIFEGSHINTVSIIKVKLKRGINEMCDITTSETFIQIWLLFTISIKLYLSFSPIMIF